jgi:DNA-binding HxlR family transcriptional regulator
LQVIYKMSKKIKRRSDCPISFALDIFGDKWSLLILRDLMFKGKRTYGEFIDSEEGIATNILADRLKMLEEAGLIISKRDEDKKTRYLYRITEKALDLVPMLLEMIKWSASHDKKTAAPKEFVNRIKNDKENFIKELSESIRNSTW